jgi:hypothetical protein
MGPRGLAQPKQVDQIKLQNPLVGEDEIKGFGAPF